VLPPVVTTFYVGAIQWTPETLAAAKCDGCGLAWLTCCANPFAPPHNPEVCAAYKRGYEDGKVAAGK
jgi:hypothetical protein